MWQRAAAYARKRTVATHKGVGGSPLWVEHERFEGNKRVTGFVYEGWPTHINLPQGSPSRQARRDGTRPNETALITNPHTKPPPPTLYAS